MRTLLAIGLVGVVSGCSKSPPTPGKVVAISNVCNETDGARVRLTGTLRYERGLLSFCVSVVPGTKSCFVNVEWASGG